MNSDNNENLKLEEEILARTKPYLEKIKNLEQAVADKDQDLIILKYAYSQILSDIENLNKKAKKK